MSEERIIHGYDPTMKPEDRPLTQKELSFCQLYLAGNSGAKSVRDAGYNCKHAAVQASQLLKKPNIARYIIEQRQKARTEAVASAEEVMEFLTKVMRGEIREHNGKQVSVAERSKAAVELAKRTVDIDNGQKDDKTFKVVLDWNRKDTNTPKTKPEEK